MKVLNKLKEIGDFCPTCDLELTSDIILTNNNNSYTYRLMSKKYPLIFTMTNPITMCTTSISLNEKDILELQFEIKNIFFSTHCPNKHYIAEICSINSTNYISTKNEMHINIDYIVERLKIGEFIIENFHNNITYISKLNKKIMKIPVKSIKYWQTKDINTFKENLDKLLILL